AIRVFPAYGDARHGRGQPERRRCPGPADYRSSTLRSEVELARAYLDVLRLRMGRRLAVEFDVPPALLPAEMPPMMLATLVENAIKHGLAPRPSGGRVRIVARQDGDLLEISVGDDGVGFQQSSGSGVGLANIRSRLA